MTAGRLLLWRHGRTAANAGMRMQGQIDEPLDDVGRWQARTAATVILARYTPTAIISSDLSRARATADYLARDLQVPVVLDARIRERAFGRWEGLSGDGIRARWPEQFAVWRAGADPEDVGVEPRARVAVRLGEAVREHAAAFGHADTLVLVSHGAAIALAIGELLGQPPAWRGVMGLRNAHWAELTPSHGDVAPAWRLHGFNLGPTDASRDWDAGPDLAAMAADDADAQTRDPD